MPDIILHNYPQSPVAEKIRVVFGIKGLDWHSVEIPRLAPKPMLTRLTGGYRRTPVMQIGADIYCDSQGVIRALDHLHPEPSLFPNAETGLMWGLSRWTDGPLFDAAVKLVLGAAGDDLPPEFAADRGRLYFGPDWAERLKTANAALPHLAAQLRTPLYWANLQFADGRAFLTGDAPAAIDAQLYHIVWFIHGRWAQGPSFLSEFTALETWKRRITDIGHGTMTDMSPQDAIAEAARHEPRALTLTDPHDPQGLKPGMAVTICPDLDGGEEPVAGTIVGVDVQTITLHRSDPETGNIHVHFPRDGYRVERQD